MTFPDTPSPLAQSMEFEVGETFGVSASVDEDDTYFELCHVFIEEYDLHETPHRDFMCGCCGCEVS